MNFHSWMLLIGINVLLLGTWFHFHNRPLLGTGMIIWSVFVVIGSLAHLFAQDIAPKSPKGGPQ